MERVYQNEGGIIRENKLLKLNVGFGSTCAQPWKKYPRYKRKEDTAHMQTYLALKSVEGGRGLAGLGRGEGGSASNKGGEGSKLEHGWISLVSIEKL